MPRNNEIKSILVIGSGPIIIGQAAEFDYSGTQAVVTLKELGYRVILLNSNPATVMTDHDIADAVYIEPMTLSFLQKIISKENPDAILPTMGGQTALNLVKQLAETSFFKNRHITLLGCNLETIEKAEDRKKFKELMEELGEPVPPSAIVESIKEGLLFAKTESYPLIIRPAYTLGGTGGGIAYDEKEFLSILKLGLESSPIHQCLVEKSIYGYKELEYEVIRDSSDNTIIVCNMENIDPVGVHTGDSIVVAPSLTLSDSDHQMLRNSAIKIIRALDIQGGCNIQFALSPHSNQYYIIEVNPRVSRSSALASKATGYPIAKIAAQIAVGLTLNEIINPVTQSTYAGFEPSLDYIVVKIPRFAFDKFPQASRTLGTQMKATGEVMAIGRSFNEAFLKAVRSLELKIFHPLLSDSKNITPEMISTPHDERIFYLFEALRQNENLNELQKLTHITPYFLKQFQKVVEMEKNLALSKLTEKNYREAKQMGFSDKAIAFFSESDKVFSFSPSYKIVDTCAGEFVSPTPYFYSSFEQVKANDLDNQSFENNIVVLGSGPIRIGQGIEFDYSAVHCVKAIRKMGLKAVTINNNPETISTDYSLSDRLYFEPLDEESVLHILKRENPMGVIVQFGGQTAINLADFIHKNGFTLLGTGIEGIELAEDRKLFDEFLQSLDIKRPQGILISSKKELLPHILKMEFPVMIRPSFVLGGRAMEIIYNENELGDYIQDAIDVTPDRPLLIDRYLDGKEIEVDALCDGKHVFIPGIMEHIERAGIHSGDSMAVYPTQNLSTDQIEHIYQTTKKIALKMNIIGVVNIQFVYTDDLFVIEVNPRASRTLPFLSKVTGINIAQVATQICLGKKLADLGFTSKFAPLSSLVHIKAPVFSFAKLTDVDTALGPEMKSTGEVMGSAPTYQKAIYKALKGSGYAMPESGSALITLSDSTKEEALPLVKKLWQMGFRIYATQGSQQFLQEHGINVQRVNKIKEGSPHIVDLVRKTDIQIVINTMSKGKNVHSDGFKLRRACAEMGVISLTQIDTAKALIDALESYSFQVEALS